MVVAAGSKGDAASRAHFLVGPTAVGKSAVAQWIAERHDYDILSADSMLIYEGMDVGTAKPTPAERGRVRYYGIDLVTPDRSFSVGEYVRYARNVLEACCRHGRRVIVVGGTGLYVKGLVEGLDAVPPPSPESRERWEQFLAERGTEALLEALRDRSAAWAEAMPDPHNPRRLLRAHEMLDAGRELPPRSWTLRGSGTPLAGLAMDPAVLAARIETRVHNMLNCGLSAEVEALIGRYPEFSATAAQAIGYAEVMALADGACSREEAIARIAARTRRLAKRQRTWFRRQAQVTWFPLTSSTPISDIAGQIMEHWRQHGATQIVT